MKFKKAIFLFIFLFFIQMTPAFALNSNGVVCHNPGILKGLRIIAMVILVIKILVPVIIIIMGIKDLAKAVIEGDDGDIQKFVPLFFARLFTGVFIFFIPTCIHAILSVAKGYDSTKNTFVECGQCLTSVKTCDNLINRYSK